jgi:transcriptional regulator with XRE-family HTH domain
MLEKFAEELKNVRLGKGLSLQQMSAKTRIDIKFLEAIDNGNFGFLPELYVKAFIKQYAKVLELDEKEILQKYEDAKAEKTVEADETNSLPEQKIDVVKKAPEPEYNKPSSGPEHNMPGSVKKPEDTKKNLRLITYSAGGLLIAVVIFFAFFNRGTTIVVEELPYEKVLEDTKDRYLVKNEEDEASKRFIPFDTLFLQFTNVDSLDSAWVMVISDDTKKDDFLLYPKRMKRVKALNNIKFTLGNSGVISLKLNNRELKVDGIRGAVRHYEVTRDTIERLYSPPILKSE